MTIQNVNSLIKMQIQKLKHFNRMKNNCPFPDLVQ